MTASANAADATSGLASQTCASVATTSSGASSVKCTATDNAGNIATATLPYTVVQVISSTSRGGVKVDAGQVVFVNGGTVSGGVTVEPGGTLALASATIHGALTATAPAAITICGSTLQGTAKVAGSKGFVLIGDGGDDGTPACAGNTVKGGVQLGGNTAGVELGGNQVSGDVTVDLNTGSGSAAEDAGKGPEIEANTIKGDLSCTGNSPVPANDGHPNTVSGSRSGQCAGL